MGWLLACLFSVLLWRTRRQLKALLRATPSATEAASAQPAPASYQNVPLAYQHLHNLVVLCLELNRWRAAGTLDPARYADLTAQVDTLWTNIVRHLGFSRSRLLLTLVVDAIWAAVIITLHILI